MSWSSWSAKLNVQSIVSQGLEQVSKLREDVEKQFDQVVTASSTQPPRSSSRSAAAQAEIEPPSAAVSAALFGEPQLNGKSAIAAAPPPRSLDSKGSATLLASLGIAKSSNSETPASAPASSTSKHPPANVDFFGSFLSTEATSMPAPSTPATLAPAAPASAAPTPAAPTPAALAPTAPTSAVSTPATPAPAAPALTSPTPAASMPLARAETNSVASHHGSGSELTAAADRGELMSIDDSGNTELTEISDIAGVRADPEVPHRDGPSSEIVSSPSVGNAESDADSPPVLVGDGALLKDTKIPEANVCNQLENEDDNLSQTQSIDDREGGNSVGEIRAGIMAESAAIFSVQDPQEPTNCVIPDTNVGDLIESAVVVELESTHLKEQLAQREAQLLSTSALIQELHDELDKTCQREVAAVEKNRFLSEQLDLLRSEVLRLNRVVSHQQQSSRDHEFAALQEAIADKDLKLQVLLDEGQALSVKQAQLEQRLRQLRREKNEEEEQKLKLQAQADVLGVQLQELSQKQKDWDDERKLLQSDLKTAHLIGDQAKNDLMGTKEEVNLLQEANRNLTTELNASKRENDFLRAEIEKLKHTSDSHATLSVEKGEMEATIQYLQQTVQDLQTENSRREELARMEISDLKRKWKEALHRVEILGHSVSEATQPLLRQVQALQEDQRARQETWKSTEKALVQRINDASAQRNALEADKVALNQHLHELRFQNEDLQLELKRKEANALRDKERIEVTLEREREARGKHEALLIELEELRSKLQDEQLAKQSLLARVAIVAAGTGGEGRSEADSSADSAVLMAEMEQLKQREQQLRHDLDWHQRELQRVKAISLSPRVAALQQRRSFDEDWSGSANGSPRVSSQNTSQASILQRTLDSSTDDSRLSTTSVLGLSQLQQRLRLREGENRLLRQQLQVVQDKQKQTADEIVRLSTRNALLESSAAQFQQTQEELELLKQKQHVLLELFGEKEEQVEELQSEVKELKAFYRKQLDTLAGQQK